MRTRDELQQKVDDDLVWRRKELSNIKAAIQDSDQNLQRQTALLRAGTAVLYAHWEGFVKRAGSYYLEFVSNQRKPASELTSNFIAIKFKTQITDAAKSKKISTTHAVIDFFYNNLSSRLNIPHKGIIDTQSNLSSTVLREIISTLGLDISPYETKKNFIDESLVNKRNHIAHGEQLDIGVDDYLLLHDEVMALLEDFRNQIQNAAATNHFLKKKI
jgi:MAE_28990/MAE_18760-like HEPN